MIRHSTTLLLTALAANVPRYSAGFIGNSGSFLSRSMPSFMNSRQVCKMSSSSVEYLAVHVFVSVKEGTEDAFKEASFANARASAKEEGIARFDVIQQIDDPTKFVLVEVYKNDEAPALHKETAHYSTWRETVADMMAEPRSAIKYKSLFPATEAGWDYGEATLE
eukprot:CAMPEP_0116067196 /NCGR_PEP_ID=MMETSP0322-20121206/10857_1 /TAXON_ID=163516 /ORGANISM="Leptocylindrus danicus var. apora, Strain B651" /LENGTH=164 /DNA_ID=CAMNT_0003553941 /DNA_START=107 /DNA_END=601 /DNA_ORIENTATION=+